jgi:hypothetical protein
MQTRPGIRWLAAAAASLAVCAVLTASGAAHEGHGRLVPASPTPSPTPQGLPVAEIDASLAKPPNCDPKAYGRLLRSQLEAAGIDGPGRLGVEMTVLKAPLTLHKLLIQLYVNDKVFWETETDCLGCLKVYPPSDEPKAPGYYFQLDPAALKSAAQAFPQATEVGLAGVVHDGAWVRFRFVKLEGK